MHFKFASATLNSFKYSLFMGIIDSWNNLPEEIAEAANLNIFKDRLRSQITNFSSER